MRITRKISGCDDGTCPAVFETDDPGMLAVQGARITDEGTLRALGPVPLHETVVLVPRHVMEEYRDRGR